MVKQREIKNVAIAVVRYFGGTKLGTGGLVRAYTHGAQLALEAAVLIEQVRMTGFRFSMDYTRFGKLQNELESRPFTIVSQEFLDRVTVEVAAKSEEGQALHGYLVNFTQGKEELTPLRDRFVPCLAGKIDGDDFLLSEAWVEN
jgi:putative IMPACT (imprinted ancient) family translation regulator